MSIQDEIKADGTAPAPDAPGANVPAATPAPAQETPAGKPSEVPEKQSIADVALQKEDTQDGKKTEPDKPAAPKKGKSMFDSLMDTKKANKELKAELAETKSMITNEVIPHIQKLTQQLIDGGITKKESDTKIQALADKYDLKPEFIADLKATLVEESKPQTPTKPATKAEPDDEEDDEPTIEPERLMLAVEDEAERFIKENPEYKGKIKTDVIAELVLSNPEYRKLSMEQLVQKIYGIETTPGMEGYNAGAGNHPKAVNLKNPTPDDHAAITAARESGDTNALKEYQDGLIERLNTMGGRSRHAK